MKTIGLFACIMIACLLSTQAQFQLPPLSPPGVITQIVGNTTLQVTYERPSARKRTIFGELVPWNQIWRTGAGRSTKISFDQPVRVGGQPVPAGIYALFTLPNPDQWLVILNTDTSLYGAYGYSDEKDVARFLVPAEESARYYEALTIDIDIIPNNARLSLSWAHTTIAFDVITTTDEQAMAYIQAELLAGNSGDSEEYALAADYLLFQGISYQDALRLAEKAYELDKLNGFAIRLKAEIYEKLRRYEAALRELDRAIEINNQRAYDEERYREEDNQRIRKKAAEIREKMAEAEPED